MQIHLNPVFNYLENYENPAFNNDRIENEIYLERRAINELRERSNDFLREVDHKNNHINISLETISEHFYALSEDLQSGRTEVKKNLEKISDIVADRSISNLLDLDNTEAELNTYYSQITNIRSNMLDIFLTLNKDNINKINNYIEAIPASLFETSDELQKIKTLISKNLDKLSEYTGFYLTSREKKEMVNCYSRIENDFNRMKEINETLCRVNYGLKAPNTSRIQTTVLPIILTIAAIALCYIYPFPL